MMRKRRWVVFERFFIAPLRLLTALLFAFSTLSVPVTVTHAQDDLATALAEVQAATTITGAKMSNVVLTAHNRDGAAPR